MDYNETSGDGPLTTEQNDSTDFEDLFAWFNNLSNSKPSNITSDCEDDLSSHWLEHSIYFQVIVSCLYFAIFCVALFGNGVVCCIVRMTPRMRTVTNYFITNLAFGDILMTIFCVPFSFVSTFVLRYWPFGSVLCKLVNYSQVVSVMVSAYTLVALAADRYRAITNPLKPRLSRPAAKCAIGIVWFGALVTALPTSIVSTLIQPDKWHEDCHKSICHEVWPSDKQQYHYSIVLTTLQFIIPLVVLIFTYTRIAIAVWGGRPPGEAENCRDTRMAKSKRKMVKMMIVVVVVFTMCWLPYNTFLLLFNENWRTWWLIPYVYFVFHWLAMSHSCYNPIIYCYMNARFRAGFLQVLCKIPCCSTYAKAKLMTGDIVNQSVAGNIPMTGVEMTDQMLFRMNTGSTYISYRRGPAYLAGRSGSAIGHQVPSTIPRARMGSLNPNNRI